MGVFTPWESANTTNQASPACPGTHRIVCVGCWSIVCSFPFSLPAMFSFPIRTIPQDSKCRHFCIGLACTGHESTLFLSAQPLWDCQSLRFAHISLTAWHDILGLIQSRPLCPQGSHRLECSPASCSSCSSPSLPSSRSAFVYKLREVESLLHHGTCSAPRTAPQSVAALAVGCILHCISLHFVSSLYLLPQTNLFRSKWGCTHRALPWCQIQHRT